MNKTCLLCTYWKPEGTIKGTIRHGGKCALTDKDCRMNDSCLVWKLCSPSQLDQRKVAGLVEEVEE